MSSEEKPEVPGYTQNAGYQQPAGYQPLQQGYQLPMGPLYSGNGSVPAAEIHHHDEEERRPETATARDKQDAESDDDIPGKGPGGMPQKYFVVSYYTLIPGNHIASAFLLATFPAGGREL
jgi:hypothetical protein